MAAETPLKRQREEKEETQIEDAPENKRHHPYNHILSLLEEEEDEPTQDISSLITTLQQELSSDSDLQILSSMENEPENPASSSSEATSTVKEDEDEKERVMRHLLEASDDELGLPNTDNTSLENGEDMFNVVDSCAFGDGLWEFEDEAANYYMLQSELFL